MTSKMKEGVQMSLFDTNPEEFDFQNQTGSVKFKTLAETVEVSGKFAMMKEAIGVKPNVVKKMQGNFKVKLM